MISGWASSMKFADGRSWLQGAMRAAAWTLALLVPAASAVAQDAPAPTAAAEQDAMRSPGETGTPSIGAPGVTTAEQGRGIALSADGRSRLHLNLDVAAG